MPIPLTPQRRTTTRPARLEEYLAVAALPPLSADDEHQIDVGGAALHHRTFVSPRPRQTQSASPTARTQCKYIDGP